jgi:hypothetical protein
MASFTPKAGGIVLALIAVSMFCFQLVHQHWLLSDSDEYILASENLFHNGVLYCGDLETPFRTDYLSKRPPLYPLLLGLFSPIPFLLIVQHLLLALNLWLAWRIYQYLNPGRKGLTFFALLALSFSIFIYPNLVMTEVWLQSMLTVAAWLLLQFWEKGNHTTALLLSITIGLSVWLKPVTWPLACALSLGIPLLYFCRNRRFRFHFKPWLIGLVAPAFVLVLGGMNFQRTGFFHISSITSINLLQYNAYYTSMRVEGEAAAERWVDEVVDEAKGFEAYAERQTFIRSEAMTRIGQYPGTYIALHLKGIAHFFLDPGRFDLYHFFGWKSARGKNTGLLAQFSSDGYRGVWTYLRQQGFLSLLLLGLSFLGKITTLIGLCLASWKFRRRWKMLALLLVIPLYLALVTGPLGASRFAVPVIPILVAVGAAGFGKKHTTFSPKNGV